jgi:hypothetical protein
MDIESLEQENDRGIDALSERIGLLKSATTNIRDEAESQHSVLDKMVRACCIRRTGACVSPQPLLAASTGVCAAAAWWPLAAAARPRMAGRQAPGGSQPACPLRRVTRENALRSVLLLCRQTPCSTQAACWAAQRESSKR